MICIWGVCPQCGGYHLLNECKGKQLVQYKKPEYKFKNWEDDEVYLDDIPNNFTNQDLYLIFI